MTDMHWKNVCHVSDCIRCYHLICNLLVLLDVKMRYQIAYNA